MPSDLMMVPILRAEIEAMDCSRLTRLMAPASMSAFQLREMYGNVVFFVDGYDAHPEELYVIPEVRRFMRQWHQMQPNWLYFGSLRDDFLKTFYVSLLESAECVRYGNSGLCSARYNIGELVNYLAADMTQADALSITSGVKDGPRLKRATAILRYFQLA